MCETWWGIFLYEKFFCLLCNIDLAWVTLYSLRDPLVFSHGPPAPQGRYTIILLFSRTNRGWVCHPPNCHFTSPRALAVVLMRVLLLPAAPPWVRTRVLPPLMRSAQRRAAAPCATGRRVMVNWMPSMVVLVIGCGAVVFGIVVGRGGEGQPPPLDQPTRAATRRSRLRIAAG